MELNLSPGASKSFCHSSFITNVWSTSWPMGLRPLISYLFLCGYLLVSGAVGRAQGLETARQVAHGGAALAALPWVLLQRDFHLRRWAGQSQSARLSGGVGSQGDLKVSVALALWHLSALFAAHGNLSLVSQTPVGFWLLSTVSRGLWFLCRRLVVGTLSSSLRSVPRTKAYHWEGSLIPF